MQTHVPLIFRLQFCGGPYIDDKYVIAYQIVQVKPAKLSSN
jgi:hypothetical protein